NERVPLRADHLGQQSDCLLSSFIEISGIDFCAPFGAIENLIQCGSHARLGWSLRDRHGQLAPDDVDEQLHAARLHQSTQGFPGHLEAIGINEDERWREFLNALNEFIKQRERFVASDSHMKSLAEYSLL